MDSDGIIISVNGRKVKMVSKIGEGGFATVFKAKDKKDKGFVVKKMIVRDPQLRSIVELEFKVIKIVNGHPNICRFDALEVKKEGEGFEAWALMEALDKSLMDVLLKMKKDKSKFIEEDIWDISMQMCRAIAYMHEQDPPIAHRDMKPENVLRDKKGHWKVIDFGSCYFGNQKLDTKEECEEAERLIETTSTPLYRAPEMTDFFGVEELTEKVDEWAIGCIIYTMCFFTNPFQKSGKLGVINGKYTIPKDNTYSADLLGLIKQFLTVDIEDRLSCADAIPIIMEHCSSSCKKEKKIKQLDEDLGGEFPVGKKKISKGIDGENAKKEKKEHKHKKEKKEEPEATPQTKVAPAAPSAPVEDLFNFAAKPAPVQAQPQANPFGAAPQQQQMNPFGAAPQQQMNPFGAAPQQQQMNPFGAAPQQNPFGI